MASGLYIQNGWVHLCAAVFASFRPHYKIIVQHCLRQQINWDSRNTLKCWNRARQLSGDGVVSVMLIHAKFPESNQFLAENVEIIAVDSKASFHLFKFANVELLEIHLESAEFVKILMRLQLNSIRLHYVISACPWFSTLFKQYWPLTMSSIAFFSP